MTDLCHSRGPLLRGGVAADQLVLQVDLHHFAHQAVRRPANRGDLLQIVIQGSPDSSARSRASTWPRMRLTRLSARFLSSGECGTITPPYHIGGYTIFY